jgi:non-specific serine/threonine protein kinase
MSGHASHLAQPVGAATSFVGRRQELAAIRALLDRSALVTLLGPGGVGKTRLASEVVRQTGARGESVRFVSLGGRRGPSVIARGLHDIGVDVGNLGAAEALERDMPAGGILVLDECEAELEAAADFVVDLMRATAEVRVLATSRRPLGIAGEQRYAVPPMSTGGPGHPGPRPDAVRLFLDRLTERRGTGAVDSEIAAIEEVCRRLDGLPLAIELAARLSQSIGVAAVLARLDAGSIIHVPLGRDVPANKRTIAATIELSQSFLEGDAHGAFPRLAVFAGTFGVDAARDVTGTGKRVERAINELVDHSLLVEAPTVGGRRRFRLLEPTRERAMELLVQSGELDTVRARHAASYRAMAGSLTLPGPEEAAVLGRLEADFDNLLVALEWHAQRDPAALPDLVARLTPFWARRGHLDEARRWLDAALARTEPKPARLLSANATILALEGRFEEALRVAASAAAEARLEHDPATEARAWATFAALTAPDVRAARRAFGRAKAAARRAHAPDLLAMMIAEHAGMEWAVGDDLYGIALAYKAGGAVATPTTPTLFASTILARRALFADDPDAVPRWRELTTVSRSLGDWLVTATCLSFLALALAGTGNERAAAAAMLEAGELVHRGGSPPARLQHVENAGLLLMRTGRPFRGLVLVLAKERLAGPDWIDSRAYWQHVRTEMARALAMVDEDPRAEARTLMPDSAFLLALEAVEEVASRARDRSRASTTRLSGREAGVAELLAAGWTNREIADHLDISERTVEAHVRHVLDKLGLFNRTQVAGWVLASSGPRATGTAVRVSADGDRVQRT